MAQTVVTYTIPTTPRSTERATRNANNARERIREELRDRGNPHTLQETKAVIQHRGSIIRQLISHQELVEELEEFFQDLAGLHNVRICVEYHFALETQTATYRG